MANLLFGIEIKQDLEVSILHSINESSSFFKLQSLSEIPKYIAIGYIFGNGFNDNSIFLIQNVWKKLTEKTSLPPEMIFQYLKNTLYDVLSEQLIIDIVQNQEWQYGIDLELAKSEANLELNNLDFFLSSAIEREILIESSLFYSLDELKQALINTYNILNGFAQFKNCQNDNYEKLLVNFNFYIERNSINTFLKKIRRSKLDYLACDQENGLFFIHLVNIVFSVYNISNVLNNYEQITNDLKNIIPLIKNVEDTFILSNLIESLCYFKMNINSNQIIQYVSMYYRKYMLYEEANYEEYKKVIAILFDRNESKLFLNQMNIDKIKQPFDFLLYNTLYMNDKNNEYSIHVRQLCKPPK